MKKSDIINFFSISWNFKGMEILIISRNTLFLIVLNSLHKFPSLLRIILLILVKTYYFDV